MDNQLIKSEEYASDIGETTEVSWHGSADMTFEQWEAVGRTLKTLGKSLAFWLGDWMAQGEVLFGEMFSQALEITGLSPETLSKYRQVALRCAPEIRQPTLTWTHHFAVAFAEPSLRAPLLEMAADLEISTRELKEIRRMAETQQRALVEAWQAQQIGNSAQLPAILSEIRLNVSPHQPTYLNGDGTLRQYDSTMEAVEIEDSDLPFHQGDLLPGDGPEEQPIFIEQIMDRFDNGGVKMTRCTRDEAAWDDIFVVAALDHRGQPYLKWGKAAKG